MMITAIIYASIIVLVTQLIYIAGTELPFYYKEILYEWNYTTAYNIKFKRKEGWVNLIKQNESIEVVQPYKNTTIQTDILSYQQEVNIHSHLSGVIVGLILLLLLYLIYTTLNTLFYIHEKQKINRIIMSSILVLTIIMYLYNTELLTAVLFKNTFFYTDNIYIKSEKEVAAGGQMLLFVLLICGYMIKLKKVEKKMISKFILLCIPLLINVYQENIVIGYEYVYLYMYIEFMILCTFLYLNIRRTNGRVVKGTCLEHKEA